jgi:SAM-dependent methyltransferase
MSDEKFILDVTCGSRSMWFNKKHPNAIYTDIRRERYEEYGQVLDIDPDILADFTDLPFEDESFNLVVFDPPHIDRLRPKSWFAKKYGTLFPGWQTEIKAGFDECMRVLRHGGILIFKWSEVEVNLKPVLDAIDYEPLFGHNTGNNLKTIWLTFLKTKI